MPDEDVIGRGGSLILTCCGGTKELTKKAGPKGHEFHHPSKGTIVSVEVVNDGTGKAFPPIPVTGSPETEIVIHYKV